MPVRDLSKDLAVNYARNVTLTYKDYDDMILEGQPNDEDEVIDNYFNMNLIFDFVTNNKRRGTVVKHPRGTYGRATGRFQTNPFFDTR